MRLILLPGIGADARLFEPQQRAFPHMEVPAWIAKRGRETLADYAQRMAESVNATDPCVVGGVSFGGAVALEMARHLPARGVILIASCRSGRAISRVLRAAEWVSRPVPDSIIEAGRGLAPWFIGRSKYLAAADRRLVLEMLGLMPTSLLRWGCSAICRWKGPGNLTVPVFQIHGGRDPVIPPDRQRVDRVIPRGGHLINLTDADEVNSLIESCLRAIAGEPPVC